MKPIRDTEPMVLFGARLRALRQQNGLTQLAVAERLCVDRTTYNKYEAGRVSPDYRGLVTLAELFGVTVDHLLGHESDPTLLVAEMSVDDNCLSEQEWLLVQMFRQLTAEEQQSLVEQAQTTLRKR